MADKDTIFFPPVVCVYVRTFAYACGSKIYYMVCIDRVVFSAASYNNAGMLAVSNTCIHIVLIQY